MSVPCDDDPDALSAMDEEWYLEQVERTRCTHCAHARDEHVDWEGACTYPYCECRAYGAKGQS